MSILAIGTVAIDTIHTPYGKAERVVGGACTYITWSASYFVDDIRIVAVVGEDFPDSELDALKSRGAKLEGLEVRKGEKSFFWEGKYHDDMINRDTLVTELNVLENFNPVVPEAYKDSDIVMLGNLAPDIQGKVLDQMNGRPKLVVLDTMNFWIDIAMDPLVEVLKRVDVLTINDEEARMLSGEHNLLKAAQKVMTMGPKYLIIKKGEHGAILFHEEKIFFLPAIPLSSVLDPTGAGDTFAGGFVGYLDKTKDFGFENIKRALVYGSTMASFCVEDFSTSKIKDVSDEDIRSRARKFKEITDFELD